MWLLSWQGHCLTKSRTLAGLQHLTLGLWQVENVTEYLLLPHGHGLRNSIFMYPHSNTFIFKMEGNVLFAIDDCAYSKEKS